MTKVLSGLLKHCSSLWRSLWERGGDTTNLNGNDVVKTVRAGQKERLAECLRKKIEIYGAAGSMEPLVLCPQKTKEGRKECTKTEVYAVFTYNREGDTLTAYFFFPDETLIKNDLRANGVTFILNGRDQVIDMYIVNFSRTFGPGNKIKMAIEGGREAKLSFVYSSDDDTAEVRFSKREADEYVEDSEYYGIVREYAGKELAGYLLVEFSKANTPLSILPKLAITR